MTRAEKAMVDKNLDLVFEFEKYVLENPGFAARIPKDATVVLQVKGDEAFNRWSRRIAQKHTKTEGGPIVIVTIRKMKPVRSRIAALKIERAA